MIKNSGICKRLGAGLALSTLFITFVSHSGERSLDAKVDSDVVHNDNMFLTSGPHDSVTGLIITPSLSGIIKEDNWGATLSARIKSYNYSDDNLDTNDQFFNLTGRYLANRDIFSLNVKYDLASNLSPTSDDFGITGKRVNRKSQSITPQYMRLLSERLVLSLSYTYSDIEYLEAEDAGYTPFESKTSSASLIYDLTEIDKFTFSITAVDYASRNDLVTYQLLMTRFGIAHKFSETRSADFLLGFSKRESTNLSTQTFDFFGNAVVQTQEIDFSNRGLVFNAGIKQLFERGKLELRVNRNNTTNSFGGLDVVDSFSLHFDEKLSSLWRYDISASYKDISSISSGSSTTDRNMLSLDTKATYTINLNWSAYVAYHYVEREFNGATNVSGSEHSNRVNLGLSYNFPTLSTF